MLTTRVDGPKGLPSRPAVIMAGPLPPAIGGMASVIAELAESELGSRCELELFNTGKTTPEDRPLLRLDTTRDPAVVLAELKSFVQCYL